MSLGDWFRRMFSSGSDARAETAEGDEGAADLTYMEETGGGGGFARGDRFAASEAAETATDDLASEEAPPDPDP